MKRYLAGNKTAYLFVLLQMILYVTFLIFDFSDSYSDLSAKVKFSIIILCFCFAFFYGKSAGRSIIFCVKTALLFTVISDLFILMLDYYIYGVITFIVVQQLYGIRILLADHKKINRLLLRVILQIVTAFSVCLILWYSGVSMEALLVISVFYFVCIVTNTFSAVKSAIHRPTNKSNILFAVGMVLFLLCDINVGIFNMSGFVALSDNLYQILYKTSTILMWTFYAPSQVLIALSISLTWQNKQK